MISPEYKKVVSALLTTVLGNNPIGVTSNLSQRGVVANSLNVEGFVQIVNQIDFRDKQDALAFLANVLDVQIMEGNPYAYELTMLRQKFGNRRLGQIAYLVFNKAMGSPDPSGTVPPLDELEDEQDAQAIINQLTPEQFQFISGAILVLSTVGFLFLLIVLSNGINKFLTSIFR